MIGELMTFELDEINNAFGNWMRTEQKIPTPASIISLIREKRKHINQMNTVYQPIESGQNKKYHELTDAGRVMFNKAMAAARANLIAGVSIWTEGAVPWYGKIYSQFTNDDFTALDKHFIELEDISYVKAQNYRNFLTTTCKFPKKYTILGFKLKI